MPSLSSLSPVVPVLLAMCGAGLVLLIRAGRQTATSSLWIVWAGIVGGTVVSTGLSAEWLNMGAGGYAVATMGGLLGGALMSGALAVLPGAGVWRGSSARAVPRGDLLVWPKRPATSALVTASAVWGAAVILAVAGLAWLGVVVLLTVAAVGLAPRGWSPVTAVFAVASVTSAAVVVADQLLLTRAGAVGRPVPTTLVIATVLLPWLLRGCRVRAWRAAAARSSLLDLATVVVSATAGLTWWRLLDGLGQDAKVSQLMRLGEDNLSHLLMLRATQDTGAVLGSTGESLELAARFDGYFTGSSSWQATVGGLAGSGSAPDAYVLSSCVLLAMLAGLAAGAATFTRRKRTSRLEPVAALGVLAVGVVATRMTLAMYELGFPGQLMVATFFVVALLVLLRDRSVVGSSALLLLLALATWWTWSLAALILLTPLPVLAVREVHRRRWLSTRVLVAGLSALAVLAMLVVVLKRQRVVAILDELNLEGAIFRGIPVWVAFATLLALPLALQLSRRRVSLPASTLVLAAGAATLGLLLWQVVRVGSMTYYSYKLEYFVLALGWAIGSLTMAALVGRARLRLSLPVRAVVTVLAVLLAVPLVTWTAENYRGWLTARAALGVDQATVCAIRTARQLPDGTVAVATGFGEPISNYLATRAMDVGTGHTKSAVLWGPILSMPEPSTWPWAALADPVTVVVGPAGSPSSTEAVGAAAETAGLVVKVDDTCG